MATYIMAVACFIIFIVVIYVLMKFGKLKNKMMRIIDGIKKKTFWNNTIRSITISYLETAIQLQTKIKLLPINASMA